MTHCINRLSLPIVCAIALLNTTTAFSGSMGEPSSDSSYVVSIGVGPVWAAPGETQTVVFDPETVKSYIASTSSDVMPSGELFFGFNKKINETFQSHLGVAYISTGNASLQGHIWDDADPLFDNYLYHYRIQHSAVVFKGKVLADKDWRVLPWISGSVGIGINRAHSFRNEPIIFEALPSTNFSSNTEIGFTYSVGAGVAYNLSSNWQVGAGYEFTDWGRNELGRAFGQTVNTGLKLGHVYTNGLIFNINYMI